MKLCSYRTAESPRLGALLPDGGVVDLQRAARAIGAELPSDMRTFIAFGDAGLDIAERALAATPPAIAGARLAPPIPSLTKNVFCVGRNYLKHVEEGARARGAQAVVPEHAQFFSKASSTVIAHEDDIVHDEAATRKLDYEAELVAVIGRQGRNLAAERALEHIYGYTVGNDVSARDAQKNHEQWYKGKSMDTFCPLGPCIVPARYLPNPQSLRITCRVNGELRQDSADERMIFDLTAILQQLSLGLTLDVGDLIMTGTPSGVGLGREPQVWLKAGDVVECEVERIGVLRNRVVRYDASR